MRKRKILYIGLVLLVIVLIASILWIRKINVPEETSVFDEIYWSPAAKFEYYGAPGEKIIIMSEIGTLSHPISRLDLVRCDEPVGQWIYKITFNCKEKVINGHEIEYIVGTNAVAINGESYTTRDDVPYERLIEYFDMKYKFFNGRYDVEN
ncbi:MAG: hypothetical protein K5629_01640 [Eubacteriales bacterium]|nr:hypothetical protein [Eubacteriales bacterium]